MAIVVGLVAGLIFLLALALLGASLRNPRWVLVGVLLALALFKYPKEKLADDLAGIEINAHQAATCAPDEVEVTVQNRGVEEITWFRFFLTGFRANYSKHVAFAALETDRIIPAGQSWAKCWVVEGLLGVKEGERAGLRWEAEITKVEFGE